MSDTTEFRVTYDGPALENHETDPRESVDLLRGAAALGRESAVSGTTRKKEVLSVGPPVAEDVLIIDDVRETASSLTSLTFKKNKRWRLSDGNLTISATITDNAFLSAVRNNTKPLSKQDVLVCRLRVRQWHTAKGARSEYEVVEVKQHLRPLHRISVPWARGDLAKPIDKTGVSELAKLQ